ncbi:PAS domain-containing sensor histidine kinase [Desulforhabdus sp. TSK]|uniref:sensor histidine kinase n=1 Tax=Desulforhabdus sp. TSK TaxID=2925014 RepID=UPI001FC839B8|nr:PAS domain-containing sensor histidine kinase [Desulforhabdus sp. TSK]GKT08837.1 two-component sensor histidine kinase [Desulforhabdus sp. TSK]
MEDKGYRKLQWKIVGTTLGFSLIPLVALGLSMYYLFSFSYTSKIMDTLRSKAENRRVAMDLFFDERVSQLTTLAYTHSLDQLKDENYLNSVFTLMQARSKSYVDLGVIDRSGNHVAYVGPYELKGLNYHDEEWFHEVMLRGIYISDVYTGFRKLPHFIIAVMRREGDNTWILRATIDTDLFDSMVKAAQSGKKGDAYVLNDDNVLQTKPRYGGELLSKIDDFQMARFVGTHVEDMIIGGERGIFATTWLRNKDWMLVIKEDPREQLLPLEHARFLVVGLGLLGLILIIVGTLFVARAMVAQLMESEREKAILDSNLMQSSKMAALGKLAAGIAHEVNNPLAVIKEKVGWMKDLLGEEDISKSENFEEFEDAVKKIDHHVDRAKKVTHRLLGFARRMEPVQEKVDVNKLLDGTLDFLRNEAHYRNIEIQTNYFEGLPETVSDSAQLQQVFLNIFNNAIDAIGKDGVISVTTSYNSRDKDMVVIVADNGPGIPNDVLNRIFDPFFTTKEVGTGTGLGLSISYSIMEKLGGRILVASEVGKGTTFSLYIPIVHHEKA